MYSRRHHPQARACIRAASELTILRFHRERPLKFSELADPALCAGVERMFDAAVICVCEEERLLLTGKVGRYSKVLEVSRKPCSSSQCPVSSVENVKYFRIFHG